MMVRVIGNAKKGSFSLFHSSELFKIKTVLNFFIRVLIDRLLDVLRKSPRITSFGRKVEGYKMVYLFLYSYVIGIEHFKFVLKFIRLLVQ